MAHNYTTDSMLYKFCSYHYVEWYICTQSHYISYVYGTAFSHTSSVLYSLDQLCQQYEMQLSHVRTLH